jgi:hypothetical protein
MQQKLFCAVNFTDDHVAHTSGATSMPTPRMAPLLCSLPVRRAETRWSSSQFIFAGSLASSCLQT